MRTTLGRNAEAAFAKALEITRASLGASVLGVTAVPGAGPAITVAPPLPDPTAGRGASSLGAWREFSRSQPPENTPDTNANANPNVNAHAEDAATTRLLPMQRI
jgi:hypothetical protein